MMTNEKFWQKITEQHSLLKYKPNPNDELIKILNDNIIEINLTGLTPSFYKRFNHPRELHRIISNGKQSIGAYTNRDFWNDNVMGGFYRYDFNNNIYKVSYYILLKVGNDITKFNRQFILRLKKLLFSVNVQITKSNLKAYQEKLDELNRDFSGYQKFGLK